MDGWAGLEAEPAPSECDVPGRLWGALSFTTILRLFWRLGVEGAEYMTRRIGAFVCAVLVTYLAGSALSTQMILQEVASFGVPVDFATRIAATLHDLAGLAVTYLPIIAIASLVAYPVTALVLRFVPGPRAVAYAIGGAAALFALHSLMFAVLGMHPLPATRTGLGMALQAAAGAIGGWTFAAVARPRSSGASDST